MFSRKAIVEKWENKPAPLSIADIQDPAVKENMAILLEVHEQDMLETLQSINEAAGNSTNSLAALGTLDGSQSNDAYKFKPIALAMVRRTFPELWANKVVGVQAMNGPVGLAYALRAIYNDTNNEVEVGWENTDYFGGFTGSHSYTSAILSEEAPGIYDTSATGAVTSAAEEWEIGSTTPDIKFKIDQKTVTAKTRKLAGSYTLESAQDLKAMHGIEVERDLLNWINYEVVAETDRELLYRMKKAAIDTSNGGALIPAINVSGTAIDGRWSVEKFANITTSILHQCQMIGVKNKRGPGNWVAVSPAVATALQAMGHPFVQNNSKVNTNQIGVAEIGTLNGNITVYRDIYARTDYALCGYKGPTTSDAGIIFCPYITGLTNRAIDPNTFAPRVQVMMRYDIVDNMLGAGRYYRLIPYSNMSTIVIGA